MEWLSDDRERAVITHCDARAETGARLRASSTDVVAHS